MTPHPFAASLAATLMLASLPASAADATGSYPIDLTTIITSAVAVFVPLFSTLILGVLAKVFKIKAGEITQQQRDAVNQGLSWAVNYGIGLVKHRSVTTHNEVVASIASYAVRHIPDALHYFGIMDSKGQVDDAALVRMINARLACVGYTPPDAAPPAPAAPSPAPAPAPAA